MIDGEVVSTDSMQVYKHMDIGTAKPTLSSDKSILTLYAQCYAILSVVTRSLSNFQGMFQCRLAMWKCGDEDLFRQILAGNL